MEEKKVIWTYYTRNDAYVKERFLANDFDTVETTGLGNFDGLFSFLLESRFFSLFDFRPDCRQRVMVPLSYLLSTYSLKVITQLSSLNQIDSFLFKDRALLELVGFTGVHLQVGFSRRNQGKHLSFHVSTLGKLLGDFSLGQSQDLFCRGLGLLEKKGFIGTGVYAADATDLYVSRNARQYEKAGEIVRDGKVRRGYKLITLKYVGPLGGAVRSEYPEVFVAGIVVPLNENENKYLLPLLRQAEGNIGKNKIKLLVMDRGFLSGEKLWAIKHTYKSDFLIYSKSNMDVTEEMKKKLADYLIRKRSGRPLLEPVVEQKDAETVVYGFNRLRWFWTYGDANHQVVRKKTMYKKHRWVPTHPISGAILTRYKGKKLATPITLLSSKRFSGSFTPLDAVGLYRKRQHIENQGFRELKQGYKIGHFPSRKFAGVVFHVLFTLLVCDFVSCYKTKEGEKLAGIGLTRLHAKISRYGCVIYAWPHFGIFDTKEILAWVGFTGKGFRAHGRLLLHPP